MISLNQELCCGCGACIDVCLNNAIRLQNGKAWINQAKCTSCQCCVEVCPTNALTVVKVDLPVRSGPSGALEIIQTVPLVEKAPQKSLLKGTALAVVSQQLLPRLMDIVLNALEQRISSPVQEKMPSEVDNFEPGSGRRQRQRLGRSGPGFRSRRR
jgi:ferredoxin